MQCFFSLIIPFKNKRVSRKTKGRIIQLNNHSTINLKGSSILQISLPYRAMRVTVVIIFMFGVLTSKSQTPKASAAEFKWAIFHPFAAIKVKKITKAANLLLPTLNIKEALDNYTAGGKADAFRHVYFMALYAQKIKAKKLIKLGKAHEKSNYRQYKKYKDEYGEKPDSLSSVMDLNNNKVGIKIGHENKSLEKKELATLVIKDIQNGKALIMKRNDKGEYLDCNGKIINVNEFDHRWYVPKCLVQSDFIYN